MLRFRLMFLFTLAMAAVQGQYIPKFDVQGHRGARGLKPENSIPAFLTALDYGVTTLEMDLAITGDSQVVVSHDPYMDASICSRNGDQFSEKEEKDFLIYKMTYAEVMAFDCGSIGNPKFPQQQKMETNKPLLKDVIVAVENHIKSYSRYEVDYNIEIKSTPAGDSIYHPGVGEFCDRVYNLLDEYLPWERIVIQSFDFRVLQYIHQKYPHVQLAALVENTKSPESNLKDLGFNPNIYSPYFKLLKKTQIRELHSDRIRVIPWTVNELGDMKKMKTWGTDGFITDYPNRARDLGYTVQIKK